jgi:hypothetical protein
VGGTERHGLLITEGLDRGSMDRSNSVKSESRLMTVAAVAVVVVVVVVVASLE